MKKDIELRQRFGNRLRALREKRGLTQEEAAGEVGVATTSWAAYEQGKSSPYLETLIAMVDLLETSIDHLLGREPELSTSPREGDIKWRPVWSSGPEGSDALAAQAWQRVITGQKIEEIATSLSVGFNDVENMMRDLVFHDRIRLLAVSTDRNGERLKEHFAQGNQSPLREVWVASLGHIHSAWARMVLLGHVAREYFLKTVKSGDIVALCGGFAVSRLVMELRRGDIKPGVNVVPVAASPYFELADTSANGLVSALAYRHFNLGVDVEELPPCLGEDTDGPAARIAKRVRHRAANAAMVFLGIGAPGVGALSRDISDVRSDYHYMAGINLTSVQEPSRPDPAVGNVMYYLVDGNGNPPRDFCKENKTLVVSIEPSGLQALVQAGRRVVVLATGKSKAPIVRAAIRGGLANVLIIDDELEAELLSMDS